MNHPSPTVRKNFHGRWEATSLIPMGTDDPREGGIRVLRISTSKGDSGPLCTSATALTVKPDGSTLWAVFEDFRKLVVRGEAKARCTEAVVRAQHDEARTQIDALLIEALAHDKENGK